MVTRLGMSSEFDMMALETVSNQYLGGDASLSCSADTAARIDAEVLSIIKSAHQKATQILTENQDALHRLAAFLLERETITGQEFMELLEQPHCLLQKQQNNLLGFSFWGKTQFFYPWNFFAKYGILFSVLWNFTRYFTYHTSVCT